MRQHASAYVSMRQHTPAYVSMHQHTSAYVSIETKRVKSEIVNLFYRFISFVIRATIGYEVEVEIVEVSSSLLLHPSHYRYRDSSGSGTRQERGENEARGENSKRTSAC